MGGVQRTGAGTNPHSTLSCFYVSVVPAPSVTILYIPLVVSKSDSNHGTATMAHRTLGLTPAVTICHSNLSLSFYPIQSVVCLCIG